MNTTWSSDILFHMPMLISQQTPPTCVSSRRRATILLLDHLSDSPVTAQQIRTATARDPLLSSVLLYIRSGWPSSHPSDSKLQPFLSRKTELSVQDGCILWGAQVIIPTTLQERVLQELHEAHPGITKMKSG